jgi:hypothetical protein
MDAKTQQQYAETFRGLRAWEGKDHAIHPM